MKKAISLKVSLWITGEDEPASNFAARVKLAVTEVIEQGKAVHPELKITIKKLKEENDDEEEAEGDEF